ncbi:hypothetical protein CL653_03870 [bacterium]|nr:hypothetical protein [bacterium]|tara:strand:+ start:644 stop:1006 length:363 start_codon:yes stop_codon:yes gene_type:complete
MGIDLQKLRQKPNYVKDQYAFWGSLLLTSLIAFVWGVSFIGSDVGRTEQAKSDNTSAFGQYINDVKSQLGAVRGVINGASSQETVTEVTPKQNIVVPNLDGVTNYEQSESEETYITVEFE